MGAELIVREKLADGYTITEVVVWRLTAPVHGCTHSFKYRFFFGLADGICIIRYDNERGKGGHRHVGGVEETYVFKGLQQLFRDFNYDKSVWLRTGRSR